MRQERIVKREQSGQHQGQRRGQRQGQRRGQQRSDPQGRFRKGRRGEKVAELLLMCKGYRILGRRLRSGGGGLGSRLGLGLGLGLGEIDLLAERGTTLVVVEVKWRVSQESAAYALHPMQQRRLRRAGEVLFARLAHARGLETLRFDVMLVAPLSIRHLTNAF